MHLSVGDMLRKRKTEGALSPEQCKKLEDQELMDGRAIVDFMEEDFEEKGLENHLIIIDGFPRNLDNVKAFENSVCERSRTQLTLEATSIEV